MGVGEDEMVEMGGVSKDGFIGVETAGVVGDAVAVLIAHSPLHLTTNGLVLVVDDVGMVVVVGIHFVADNDCGVWDLSTTKYSAFKHNRYRCDACNPSTTNWHC